jgi:hypothetical protein
MLGLLPLLRRSRNSTPRSFAWSRVRSRQTESPFADRLEANRLAVIDRFELLDRQTIKAAADVKSAVDAAFAAAAAGVSQQNEANFLASQKQELAFTKQIDQLAASVVQISKANDDKLNDLKDRLVAMEGRSSVIDPTTVAALRDQAQTIAVLKQSNDQASGVYRQRTDSTGGRRHRRDGDGNVPDRPLNLVEELARASASLRKRHSTRD